MSDHHNQSIHAAIGMLRRNMARDQKALEVLEQLLRDSNVPPDAALAAIADAANKRGRPRKVDPDQVRTLHAQGLLDGQIGERLGVGAGAILQWRRKLGLAAHPRHRPQRAATALVERVSSSAPIVRWLRERGTIIAAGAEPGLWKVNDRDTIDHHGLLTMANRKRQLAGLPPFVWDRA